ncbi:hypothetical protein SAMD00023353_2100480 [Rosellinia necatrix]|uniref:Uncharacterized protein n=1 Tax=Rosellinia necatrix TaxID=77044 RepID=A0A1W2TFH7_ROSNE|nr:hypothetical protein SAMD00023353_2100480 [Rosellinia necatrix]
MALDTLGPTHAPLLALPPEIRNAIYELVVKIEWGHTSQDFFVLDRPLPALFRVSRQIRSEALDVFLLKNHFHVYTSSIGLKWLDILGTDVVRFRFLILFIDLNLEAWHKYVGALLPFVSIYLELRIRRAAASLSDQRLEKFLQAAGLCDAHRWTRQENGFNETIFRRIEA